MTSTKSFGVKPNSIINIWKPLLLIDQISCFLLKLYGTINPSSLCGSQTQEKRDKAHIVQSQAPNLGI